MNFPRSLFDLSLCKVAVNCEIEYCAHRANEISKFQYNRQLPRHVVQNITHRAYDIYKVRIELMVVELRKTNSHNQLKHLERHLAGLIQDRKNEFENPSSLLRNTFHGDFYWVSRYGQIIKFHLSDTGKLRFQHDNH